MRFSKRSIFNKSTRVGLQIKLQVQNSTPSTLKKDVLSTTQALALGRVMDGQGRLRKIAYRYSAILDKIVS